MTPCFYFYSLSSLFSTSHIRSFCVSFLLLSIVLTFINFLTTTTSVNKLTTNEYKTELNLSTTTISLPILLLDSKDVYHNRFNCYERTNRQRLYRKKTNKTRSNITMELNQPNITLFERNTIPYDYDIWQSAPTMPRLVSKCEHNLMMQLLKRFDQLTKKYSLEYMIIDGTLLGSWRHHDLIPWDDDIDLMMSVRLKHLLIIAIESESPSSPYYIEFHRRWDAPKAFEYYKFYFSTSPHFSEHPWRYPFVDLIFYHENETHIWQENMQHVATISKQSIFPLQLRPFGSLWLPSPRSPHDYFLSVSWTTYDDECYNGPWSHKYERTKDMDYGYESKSIMNCYELKEFYPFVERSLINQEERLIINGTVKQIIRMINDK
ncbi:unnamed protein product [Adineta steineri]|uniref:LicD/FKTN/FKRP nucleotidyltransferase domain-containing protein n=3 Tax=Adineta steineri TaxID=433720 RepID=A0A813MIH6_9BILA|nr:unnamed protein product [Adineta steineri]